MKGKAAPALHGPSCSVKVGRDLHGVHCDAHERLRIPAELHLCAALWGRRAAIGDPIAANALRRF